MIRKIFRQMLVTQILSAMTVMLCMLVDSMMIGRFLGVDSMTAYGLANPVLLVFAAYGAMLSAGIQVMCGKTMGAGDREGTPAFPPRRFWPSPCPWRVWRSSCCW